MLACEEFHPFWIIVSQFLQKLLMGAVLASKAQYQHSSRIGVPGEGSQKFPCLGMICTGLAAAEGVGKGVQAVDMARCQGLVLRGQPLCDIVDTTHGGDDPDFVPRGGSAVRPQISPKGSRWHGSQFLPAGLVAVSHFSLEVGLHVMGVYPLAGLNIFCGVPDGKSVLYHMGCI